MANDLNVVAIVGRLVREAEVKYTSSGAAMVRFSIAVNRNRRMNDGSWNEEPSYFDCLYAGKSAENVSQYLEKGRQVAIQGELRQNRWTDQEGQTRSRVEIFVNTLTFIGGGQRDSNAPQLSKQSNNNAQTSSFNRGYNDRSDVRPREPQMPLSDGPEDFQDDDIPF